MMASLDPPLYTHSRTHTGLPLRPAYIHRAAAPPLLVHKMLGDSLFHDHSSANVYWLFIFKPSLLKHFNNFPDFILGRHWTPHLLCWNGSWFYFDLTRVISYPMNRVSQPSVNSFCCRSTSSLACIDGTIIGLFIAKVIRLTVGNSGMVTGITSRSRVVSSSLFTKSKLFLHAGILKTS